MPDTPETPIAPDPPAPPMPGWPALFIVAALRLVLVDGEQIRIAWQRVFGQAPPQPAQAPTPSQLLESTLTMWTVLLAAALVMGALAYRRPWHEPFALRRPRRKWALVTVAGLAAVAALVFAGQLVDNFLPPPDADAPMKILLSPELRPMLFFTALAIAPLAEELFFRGFVYGIIERRAGRAAGLAIVTAWFGLIHAPQWTGSAGVYWGGVAVITAAGLVFGLMRAATGSLFPAVACHLAYNAALIGLWDL
jgi:membrane protease YdiL (CAAX protease family)